MRTHSTARHARLSVGVGSPEASHCPAQRIARIRPIDHIRRVPLRPLLRFHEREGRNVAGAWSHRYVYQPSVACDRRPWPHAYVPLSTTSRSAKDLADRHHHAEGALRGSLWVTSPIAENLIVTR